MIVKQFLKLQKRFGQESRWLKIPIGVEVTSGKTCTVSTIVGRPDRLGRVEWAIRLIEKYEENLENDK